MVDKTILCFGDSNTHGTTALAHMDDIDRFPKDVRWPNVMGRILGEGFDVIEEGHPGRNAAFDDPVEGEHKNGLRILPALLQSHKPLDLLIVMLGTNDLKARFNVPPLDIALALERLAVANQTYGMSADGSPPKLLYIAPVPIEETGFLGEMFAGGAAKSRALPAYLKVIAERTGSAFLDLTGVAEVDMIDGIHLTAEGQAAVGRAIASKVKELFELD
ncbi:MAG: SGNH/GDSL hydrolase family protein [Pseudomonadota bacterium]